MASHLRVRAFSSSASSALLKLKRHRHYNNQPHELAPSSRFVFTPSFLRSFSNANRSAASVNPNLDIPISESDSDSEYDSDYVSPSWAKITGLERPLWLKGSNCRYIPCSKKLEEKNKLKPNVYFFFIFIFFWLFIDICSLICRPSISEGRKQRILSIRDGEGKHKSGIRHAWDRQERCKSVFL